jgi:hypothetical protein
MNETTTTLNGYSGTTTSNHSGITTGLYTGNIGMGTCNPSERLTVSGNHSNGIGAIGTAVTPGLQLSGNATIIYSTNQFQNNMTPKQVNVAVFTITRDEDTNEINSTKFLKELWIEQKNGTSIDLLVAKQLGNDFDPELTIIKTLSIVNF